MSITSYNGSAVLAMVGKECVAVASDRRFGAELQTIACDFERVFKIHDHLFVGLSGLGTDVQTLSQRFRFRHKLYELREERKMQPEAFMSMVCSMLYEKRFGPYFVEPVIAGLRADGTPYVASSDLIGAKEEAPDFVVCGTAKDSLFGACESFFRPDMEPDDLFETVSQALLSSVDRDAMSGWGGVVYIMSGRTLLCETYVYHIFACIIHRGLYFVRVFGSSTKDRITVRELKGRMD